MLRARHGSRIAGKWVVFSTTIADVPLIAIAYAWSQSNIAFILSTCGTTCAAEEMYKSSFEDEFGHCTLQGTSVPLPHCISIHLPIIG
jgi:hypothetical protein